MIRLQLSKHHNQRAGIKDIPNTSRLTGMATLCKCNNLNKLGISQMRTVNPLVNSRMGMEEVWATTNRSKLALSRCSSQASNSCSRKPLSIHGRRRCNNPSSPSSPSRTDLASNLSSKNNHPCNQARTTPGQPLHQRAPWLRNRQEATTPSPLFGRHSNPTQPSKRPHSTRSRNNAPKTNSTNDPTPSQATHHTCPAPHQSKDPYKANLSALLGSREGQDTFGNVGDLRIPAQHTAPGTFVNSAGAGSMGRLESSKTGTNPFFTQNTANQFQYPAQTGPASNFGSSNPFGPRPGQQQQGQPGGSLIDL